MAVNLAVAIGCCHFTYKPTTSTFAQRNSSSAPFFLAIYHFLVLHQSAMLFKRMIQDESVKFSCFSCVLVLQKQNGMPNRPKKDLNWGGNHAVTIPKSTARVLNMVRMHFIRMYLHYDSFCYDHSIAIKYYWYITACHNLIGKICRNSKAIN